MQPSRLLNVDDYSDTAGIFQCSILGFPSLRQSACLEVKMSRVPSSVTVKAFVQLLDD